MKWWIFLLAACGPAATPLTAPGGAVDLQAATFGTDEWRVPGTVDHIAFSADERSIIVGTQHGTVVRFAIDGTRHVVVEGAIDEAYGFGDLDNALVLAGKPSIVVDLASGAVRPFGVTEMVTALTVAGTRAVVATDDGPLVVMAHDGATRMSTLEHSRGFAHPAISGDWVIAGRRERAVGIWELATGKRHRVFALGNSPVFALSPDHKTIVAGTFPGTPQWAVDLYRVDDGARTATVGFACNPAAAAISPGSDLLAIACDEEVRIVKVPNGEPVTSLTGPGSYVRTIAWSPSGSLLAVGGNDNVLHVWRAPGWQRLTRVIGSRGEVRALDAGGGHLVAHAWGDDSAWLWQTDPVRPIIELGGSKREVMAAALDGDQVLLAVMLTGDTPRTSIERWRGSTRVASTILPEGPYGMSPLVRVLGGLAGGGVWYTASGQVTVLDAELRPRWSSPSETDPMQPSDGIAGATRDGRRIVVRRGNTLEVIDAVERRIIAHAAFAGCDDAPPAVAPDGTRAALIDRNGVTIVDTSTGKAVTSLAFPSAEAADRAVAWRSNAEVVGLAGGALVAWQIDSPSAAVMRAPDAVSVALDGDRIYLGRSDGTVARRSLGAMRTTARMLAARRAEPCQPRSLAGDAFGTLFGNTMPRGRLDDAGAYDEPDPAPPAGTPPAPD